MKFRFGQFEADEERFELRRQGLVVPTQRHVLELILFLLKNRGRLVTKQELVQGPWRGLTVGDAALNRAVMLARRALGRGQQNPVEITTVHGKGFRFDAAVTELDELTESQPPTVVSSASTFVGRRDELAELLELFERARCGSGSVAILTGIPGIGKTALLEHLAEMLSSDQATVVWGRCWDGMGAPAFWPWLEIARALGRLSSNRLAEVELSEHAHLLQTLESDLAGHDPDRHGQRFRAFDQLAHLLSKAAEVKPILALIDDLHEADPASLDLLEFLSRRLLGSRVLVIATSRSFQARSAEFAKLELGGLSGDEVAALLGLLAHSRAPDALARAVQRATDGHPLLVAEFASSTAINEFSDRDGARELALPRIPEKLAKFVRAEVALLPGATRQALEMAAVLGREFSWPLVRRALGLPAEVGLAPLEPALLARLVEAQEAGPGCYRFTRGLCREVVYQDLGPTLRAELHERAGSCLETATPPLNWTALSLQFAAACAASGAHAEKAHRYGLLAAADARRACDYTLALEHYSRTLRLLDAERATDTGERARILIQVAEVEAAMGEPQRARATLERARAFARAAGEVELFAEAALASVDLERELSEIDRALGDSVHEALAKVPRNGGLYARLLAAHAVRRTAESPEALPARTSARAVAIARETGEPRTLFAVLHAAHSELLAPARLNEASQRAEEMKALAEASGDRAALMEARLWQARHALELGRSDDFASEAAEHAGLALGTRHATQLWFARVLSATRSYRRARIDESQATLREGLALAGSAKRPLVQAMFASHLLNIAFELCGGERRRALEEVQAIGDALDARPANLRPFRFLRPLVRLHLGDTDGARRAFDASPEDVLGLPEDADLLPSLVSLIDLLSAFEERRGLREAYARLRPHAGLHVCSAFSDWGPVSFHLGRAAQALGEEGQSRAYLEQALGETEGEGSRPWRYWTRHRYARALAQSPHEADRREATSLIAQTRHDARRYRMAALAQATRFSGEPPSPRLFLEMEPPLKPVAPTARE